MSPPHQSPDIESMKLAMKPFYGPCPKHGLWNDLKDGSCFYCVVEKV